MSMRVRADQEEPLKNLLLQAGRLQENDRQAAVAILLPAIAAVPHENAANVLAKAAGLTTDAMRQDLLGTPTTPGSILHLPAPQQVEPLETLVLLSWHTLPRGNPMRLRLAAIVQALPEGVGDDLKRRAVNP